MAKRKRVTKKRPAPRAPATRALWDEEDSPAAASEQLPADLQLVGIRDFARARGVRQRDVQDAIARGVLRESVHVRGDRRLLDADLAAREWDAAEPETEGPLGRTPITAGEVARAARPGAEGPTPLTVRAFARRMGLTEGAVRDAIARGRLRRSLLQVGERQLIDPIEAEAEWAENTEARPEEGEPQARTRRTPRAVLDALAQEDLEEDEAVFMTERAARERWARRKQRLEVLKLRGELIEKAEVDRRAFAAARAVRDALKALPDRLSPVLAPVTDPGEIGRLLELEIAHALEEMDDALAARGQADAG